jgi:hypothetical protein
MGDETKEKGMGEVVPHIEMSSFEEEELAAMPPLHFIGEM